MGRFLVGAHSAIGASATGIYIPEERTADPRYAQKAHDVRTATNNSYSQFAKYDHQAQRTQLSGQFDQDLQRQND